MYKLIKNVDTGRILNVLRLSDGLFIPITDSANTDYQAYLQWLAEGNEPLPADEPEQQP